MFYFILDVIEELYNATNAKTKVWQPLVSQKLRDIVKENSDVSFLFQIQKYSSFFKLIYFIFYRK
jgi:hypothetical protein